MSMTSLAPRPDRGEPDAIVDSCTGCEFRTASGVDATARELESDTLLALRTLGWECPCFKSR